MFTSCALMESSNNVFQASLMFRLSLKCRNVIQETTEITQKYVKEFLCQKYIASFLIFILSLPEFLNFLGDLSVEFLIISSFLYKMRIPTGHRNICFRHRIIDVGTGGHWGHVLPKFWNKQRSALFIFRNCPLFLRKKVPPRCCAP